jgi:hypothetical protein
VKGQIVRLFDGAARAVARRLIDLAPFGAVVQISAPRRTTEQNSKLWAMLSDVARAKPEGRVLSTDDWKALFMSAAGFKCRFEPGIDGEGFVPLGFKSSRLSKIEFSDVIEAMYEYGARHGIEWSEPQGIAARSDETRSGSAEGKSPVGAADAENTSPISQGAGGSNVASTVR